MRVPIFTAFSYLHISSTFYKKLRLCLKKTYFFGGCQRLLNLQIHRSDYIFISICSGKRAQKKGYCIVIFHNILLLQDFFVYVPSLILAPIFLEIYLNKSKTLENFKFTVYNRKFSHTWWSKCIVYIPGSH